MTTLTAARAAADRQMAHIDNTIDTILLPLMRKSLETSQDVDAWAHVGMTLTHVPPQFLAEMLSRLTLRVVRGENH